jgi:hypothetical protein
MHFPSCSCPSAQSNGGPTADELRQLLAREQAASKDAFSDEGESPIGLEVGEDEMIPRPSSTSSSWRARRALAGDIVFICGFADKADWKCMEQLVLCAGATVFWEWNELVSDCTTCNLAFHFVHFSQSYS